MPKAKKTKTIAEREKEKHNRRFASPEELRNLNFQMIKAEIDEIQKEKSPHARYVWKLGQLRQVLCDCRYCKKADSLNERILDLQYNDLERYRTLKVIDMSLNARQTAFCYERFDSKGRFMCPINNDSWNQHVYGGELNLIM